MYFCDRAAYHIAFRIYEYLSSYDMYIRVFTYLYIFRDHCMNASLNRHTHVAFLSTVLSLLQSAMSPKQHLKVNAFTITGQ